MTFASRLRARFRRWRARRDMSPVAWEAHRRAIEAASRYEDDRELDRQCDAARDFVARLEAAAAVGSRPAKERLRRLRHNPVGSAAAKAADEALHRLNAAIMAGRQ